MSKRKEAISWCIFRGRCPGGAEHIADCPRLVCTCETGKLAATVGPLKLSTTETHCRTCPRAVYKFVDAVELAEAKFIHKSIVSKSSLAALLMHEDWSGIYDAYPQDSYGLIHVPWGSVSAETPHQLSKQQRLSVLLRYVEVTAPPPTTVFDLVYLTHHFKKKFYEWCSVKGTRESDLLSLIPAEIPLNGPSILQLLTTEGRLRRSEKADGVVDYYRIVEVVS